jgi:hypothetical protein
LQRGADDWFIGSDRNVTPRLIGVAAAALLALCGLCATASSASAATGFNCDASAVRGTLLGGAALEPVVANRGQATCNTVSAGLNVPLAGLLTAQAGFANTVQSGPADRVDLQSATATGGLAQLGVLSLPTLPITLPTAQIGDALANFTVPLTQTVKTALALLGVNLGDLTVDLRPALQALVPNGQLPTAELLHIQGAVAYAGARCVDGAPSLQGASSATGVNVFGQVLPVDQVINQVLTLINSGSIDPSNANLALISLPVLPALEAAVRLILNPVLDALLDTLPTISIPATVASVNVTPGAQVKTADALYQQGLRVQVSIAGQSLADVVVGEATVRATGVDCTPPAATQVDAAEAAATDLVLGCTKRRLVLTDVQERAGKVRLLGVADRSLAGQQVKIVFPHTGKVVATPTIRPDGGFSAKAKLPPKALRSTNDARYMAVVGKEKSLSLKLERRMIVTRADSANGKVTIAGRLTRPLSQPASTITVSRRVSCKKTEVVKRIKPSANGKFKVTVDAPEGELAAVYRLTSRVRKTTRNHKTYPTFTLPRAIALD